MAVIKRGLKWLTGRSSGSVNSPVPDSVRKEDKLSPKYRPVIPGAELLATARRQKQIRMLRENSPLSGQVISAWWITPLEQLAERVQDVPACWEGAYSEPGGFIDLSLEVAVRAVRLTRGMMLPPGATPEAQSEQVPGWVCAVYWAALFHHLDWLAGVEGGTENGRVWYPGLSAPAVPWRIRPRSGDAATGFNVMYIASNLLPASGVLWLQRWPALTQALFTYLSGAKAQSGILHSIISDARASCGPDVSGMATVPAPSATPVAALVPAESQPESPRLSVAGANPLSSKDNASVTPVQIASSENHYDASQTASVPATEPVPPALISAFGSSEEEAGDQGGEAPEGEDDQISTAALLSVLDSVTSGSPGDSAGQQPTPESGEAVKTTEHGELFFVWLKQSVIDGTLSINQQDSVLHIMASFVFLISPDCFYQYMSGAEDRVQDKDLIQRGFEELNIHYERNGKGLYHYHKYEMPDQKGRYTKVSGYMIPSGILFSEVKCPESSTWLSPRT
ncbi:DNA-binding domain-containing protein [Citrobacter koseri]|uniref:TraI domain-containing protein n=1 Tax=Citrobacter koseri TaxID=545 RepID=UPI0018E111AD|nr:TraI domain-containing protein [Citrobacter koseri]MBI0679105.1 DNA-binding domain-containing protein [Citrobacter koseri]